MEKLGIDGKLLLAQIVNFGLVFIIFKKFIAKPFGKFLNQEKNREKEKEAILAEIEKKQEEVNKKNKEIIEEARGQASKIVKDAKSQALTTREEMIKKAGDEVSELQTKAKKQLEEERERLYEETKSHVVEVSGKIAKETLRDFIDEKRQKEILQKILANFNKKSLYEN